MRKIYQKRGVHIEKEVANLYGNEIYGFSIIVAGGFIVGTIFFLLLGLSIQLSKFFNVELILGWVHVGLMAGVSYGLPYIFVFRRNNYLNHFGTIKKKPKSTRYFYYLTSLLFLFFILGLFIY